MLLAMIAPGCERLGLVSLAGGGEGLTSRVAWGPVPAAPEPLLPPGWVGLVASLTSTVLDAPRSVAEDRSLNKPSVSGILQ